MDGVSCSPRQTVLINNKGERLEKRVYGGVLELVVLCVFNHTLCHCVFWWADKHNSTA